MRLNGVAGGRVKAGGARIDIGPNADITGQRSAGAAIVNVEGRVARGAKLTSFVVEPPAGTYEVYCPVEGHKDKGMAGTVRFSGEESSG